MRRRSTSIVFLLGLLGLAFLAATPAEGQRSQAACGANSYAYAGLQADHRASGVAATLVPLETPSVLAGHVAGWIGVGGSDGGPGGTAEWLQVGLDSIDNDQTSRMYYEVTVAGSQPKYVELDANVPAGEKHHLAVLEMAKRKSWWRVWVDHRAVTAPIHLPGSHAKWYPQAVAENWNGNKGACNAYDYRFANVKLARRPGGVWRPLKSSFLFHDVGYQVMVTSRASRSFEAASVVRPAVVRQTAAAAATTASAPADAPVPEAAPVDAASSETP